MHHLMTELIETLFTLKTISNSTMYQYCSFNSTVDWEIFAIKKFSSTIFTDED
jgi:hypothetical protein